MKAETTAQPQDGRWVSSSNTGHARLQTPQDAERAAREPEHPLIKFEKVWSEEFKGNSGTERLQGQ